MDKDACTTTTLFGGFIHTYKFDQAVADGVILDLRYESRTVPQDVKSPDKIDAWFESKTKGLMPKAVASLKAKWATMQQLYSSHDRLSKIALDIIVDFGIKPRLANGRGNALLVAGSIAEACRYYEIFQNNNFKKCAVISSYKPDKNELRTDSSGIDEDSENWKKQKIYLRMLGFTDPNVNVEDENLCKIVEQFEKEAKRQFIEEPANMQLLIVVDKLLTGFDAPPCTYLYIDKAMHDHGLFQAICRTNRLDGEDKDFGYIVDYKELFSDLTDAVNSYTGGALSGYAPDDVSGLLKNRLDEGRKRFETLLSELETLTNDVAHPRDDLAFKHFFCGESGTVDPEDDSEYARLRSRLYKTVSSLVRAYADIKPEMTEAGYSPQQQKSFAQTVKSYTDLKAEIGLSSGDFIDLKKYDSDMRFLIDNFIRADDSEKLGNMEDFSLLAYIEHKKEEDDKHSTAASSANTFAHTAAQKNVAETIENNMRKKIIEKNPVNPKYYEKMSKLFQTLVEERKQEVESYREMLKKYETLVTDVDYPDKNPEHPDSIRISPALCALYDNFGQNENYAKALHKAIMENKMDHFRGDMMKERKVKSGIYLVVEQFNTGMTMDEIKKQVESIYAVAKEQEEY